MGFGHRNCHRVLLRLESSSVEINRKRIQVKTLRCIILLTMEDLNEGTVLIRVIIYF